MTESGALFLGLTAIVAGLMGLLAFAFAKFVSAARAVGKERAIGAETALMSAAVEQAVQRLREQERAMKERAEASERLNEQIVASITSGLMVVTSGRTVRTLNPAGRRILGLPESGEGARIQDVLRSAPPLAAVIEECLSTRRPVLRRAVQMRHTSGQPVHLGVTVSPIQAGDDQVHGAICLFTDLTAVVELEEQLRLKDSLARLGEMTAGIAHEFRNGLATIHGYGRLLDLERLPEDFRPYVAGIREETEALRQVVINFLNFAKPAELTLSPVPLRAIAERAAEEIRPDVSARGGDVHVSGEFETVEGDEVLLRQAIGNLCRNAVEACAEADVPRVSIEGRVDRAQKLQVMTITDNGSGVNADVTARMFRPFFTTKKSGTGLGLSVVQKIIVTHNGRVSAENAEHGGARIIVTLPLRSA
ncbi:MAG TPA: ATP-binding protein [Vicinamibacterales bacterium]